jgi:hypothetical protein
VTVVAVVVVGLGGMGFLKALSPSEEIKSGEVPLEKFEKFPNSSLLLLPHTALVHATN